MRGITWLRRPARGEDGNLIIAMMIILVITTIATAAVFREIGDQTIVVTKQQTASALATANAGLSDALFRLDQGTAAEGSGTQFYVDTTSSTGCSGACVGTALPGVGAKASVKYVANQISPTEWTIDSLGTVGQQNAAVHEVVSRNCQVPLRPVRQQRSDVQRQARREASAPRGHGAQLCVEPERLGQRPRLEATAPLPATVVSVTTSRPTTTTPEACRRSPGVAATRSRSVRPTTSPRSLPRVWRPTAPTVATSGPASGAPGPP